MRRNSGVILALVLLSLRAFASAQSLEDVLRKQLAGKDFTIRNFYSATDLHFDRNGALVGTSDIGPWTRSAVLVKDVSVSGDALQLTGHRAGQAYKGGGKFKTIELPEDVSIHIDLGPNASAESADATLKRVFIDKHEDLATMVPPYWQPFLRGQIDRFGIAPTIMRLAAERVGGNVKPPIWKPEPRKPTSSKDTYSHSGKKAVFKGSVLLWLVIGTDGKVADVVIVRPAGMGVDEQVVENAKRSEFEPATKKGVPVAVQINMEYNLDLY